MAKFSLFSRLSLRAVVIGGVVIGLTGPLSLGMFYSLNLQEKQLTAEADAAHSRAANILTLGVKKALWDFSVDAAAALIHSVMDDTRIVRIAIYDNKGKVFFEEKDEARRLGHVTSLERPVMHEDGPIGHVTVEFSMAQAETQIATRRMDAIILSLIQALACISILVLLINRRVLAHISILKTQASKIADKQLDEPFIWQGRDEIGTLGAALETTRLALKGLFAEVEQKNVDLEHLNGNLESIVAERTATIKMILDHVRSGFLLVNRAQNIQSGYTRSCETLLESQSLEGAALTTALGLKGKSADQLRGSIELAFADLLPEGVSVSQIQIGERFVSLEGSPIQNADSKIDQILFTIVDVTALDAVERENRANRSMIRILQNIESFRDFISDTVGRIQNCRVALQESNELGARHDLHTLKGNSSAFGLDTIARMIHEIEDETIVSSSSINALEAAFRSFLEEHNNLLQIKFGDTAEEQFLLKDKQVKAIAQALEGGQSVADVKTIVKTWLRDVCKVPMSELLGPMETYAEELALTRDRRVELCIVGGSLRVDKQLMKDVAQNIVHLVRNAIDHGIEAPEDRGDKDERGNIRLDFSEANGMISIVMQDDGRGIDTKRVIGKAIDLGHITVEQAAKLSHAEALMLVFGRGLSTAETINDTSGRGVGMSAVKESIETLGGTIHIESELGKGTIVTLTLPSDGSNAWSSRIAA